MTMSSRSCPSCGSVLDDGAQFCARCGTPVRSPDASQVQATGRRRLPIGVGVGASALLLLVLGVGLWVWLGRGDGNGEGRLAVSGKVPPSGSATVSAAEGGVVRLGDEAALRIPAGSLSADAVVQISRVDAGVAAGESVESAVPVGAGYEVSIDAELVGPVVLKLAFDAGRASGGDRGLFAAFFDEVLGEWVAVTGEVDWESGVVRVETDHLSWWRVWEWLIPTAQAPTFIAPAETAGAAYVALGDSYSAGEGVPPFLAGSDVEGTNQCHRSEAAYPALVTETLGVEGVNVACSGATIVDLLEGGLWNELAQVALLHSGVEVVSVTVGGNDALFSGVMQGCVVLDCVDLWTGGGIDTLDLLIDGLQAALVDLYEQIRERAPRSRVFVLGYPRLIADEGSWSPTCLDGIKRRERVWLRAKSDRLNLVIQAAAGEVDGVFFVSVADTFEGHEACSQDPWIRGLNQRLWRTNEIVYSFHPNDQGHQALTKLLLQAIQDTPTVALEYLQWRRIPHDRAVFANPLYDFQVTAMRDVAVGDSGLVAVGYDWYQGAVWTSPDGVSWSRVDDFEGVLLDAVTTWDSGLVAVGCESGDADYGCLSSSAYLSSDGASWTEMPHVFTNTIVFSVTAGGPGLVAVGSVCLNPSPEAVARGHVMDEPGCDDRAAAVWTSRDGVSWSRVPHDESVFGRGSMRAVTVGGPGLVAVGHDGSGDRAVVWTSHDGLSWSRVPHDEEALGGAGMEAVTTWGSRTVAVGYDWSRGGTVMWVSSDGLSWSRMRGHESVFGGSRLRSVTAWGSGLVGFGGSGEVWTSSDGVTWSQVLQADSVFASGYVSAVIVGGPGLVAVGSEGLPNGSSVAAVWVAEPTDE
jgi:lysophospholipase L1-like esterase